MLRRFFLFSAFLAVLATVAPVPAVAQKAFNSDRITVRVEGKGRDVILIPGLTSSPRVWAEMVKALPGYRYHLVQVSGFAGQLPGANAEGPVSAPVAEEIARYIKIKNIKKPMVIGHSMGGTIGLMLSARHPDAVSKLMVVDMVPFLGAVVGGPDATVESVRPIADGIRKQMLANTGQEARRKAIEPVIVSMIDTVSMREAAIQDGLMSDPVVSANAYHELFVSDLRSELRNITAPVTVLYITPKGVPVTDAQMDANYAALYSNVPQLTLRRAPNAAHFIMWDNPEWFQAVAKAFLD